MSNPSRARKKINPIFAQLPPELKVIVLSHVYQPDPNRYLIYLSENNHQVNPLQAEREKLKPLRLIARAFHDAITPFVFASVHIHASELSLQRAEKIAASRFAGHVQEIVYHDGSFATILPDRDHFNRILISHRRRQDYPKDYNFAPVDQLYENYLDEIRAAHAFRGFKVPEMCSLMHKFTNCLTFTALPYSNPFCDPSNSAYTLRRTGLSYLPNPYDPYPPPNPETTINPFIASIAPWKPRLLNLTNFQTWAFKSLLSPTPVAAPNDDSQVAVEEDWADRLTSLKVGWPEESYPNGPSSYFIPRLLTNLFQRCQNLTRLELTSGLYISPYTQLFAEDTLPRLTHLTISLGSARASWSEEVLFNQIKSLGATLKHLHLESINLESHVSGPRFPNKHDGSIIRLLFHLSHYLVSLQTCTGLSTVIDVKTPITITGAPKLLDEEDKNHRDKILCKIERATCGLLAWPTDLDIPGYPLDNTFSRMSPSTTESKVASNLVFKPWSETFDPWNAESDQMTTPCRHSTCKGSGVCVLESEPRRANRLDNQTFDPKIRTPNTAAEAYAGADDNEDNSNNGANANYDYENGNPRQTRTSRWLKRMTGGLKSSKSGR